MSTPPQALYASKIFDKPKGPISDTEAELHNHALTTRMVTEFLKDPETDLTWFLHSSAYDAAMRGRKSNRIPLNPREKANSEFIAEVLVRAAEDPSANLAGYLRETYAKSKKANEVEMEAESTEEHDLVDEFLPCRSSARRRPMSPSERKAEMTTFLSCDEGLDLIQRVEDILGLASAEEAREYVLDHMVDDRKLPGGELEIIRGKTDETNNEYVALEYLAEHASEVPAPRPLGAIESDDTKWMFTIRAKGSRLDSVWEKLDRKQKLSIRDELHKILLNLRSHGPVGWTPYGPISGGNLVLERIYQFTNIHYTKAKGPVDSIEQFEDLFFSYRPWIADEYVEHLRRFLPGPRGTERMVFTHGDLRPRNIMVDLDDQGEYYVTDIINWQNAGWMPEYWEAVQLARYIHPSNVSDWHLYIPECISPHKYSAHCLVDCLWNQLIEKVAPGDTQRRKYALKKKLGDADEMPRPRKSSSAWSPPLLPSVPEKGDGKGGGAELRTEEDFVLVESDLKDKL